MAMMIAVFALWSSIALEKAALRRAASDARASRQTLERLREQTLPASQPASPYPPSALKTS